MKKIITLILIVTMLLTLTFALSACDQGPTLTDNWRNYEKYVFSATHADTEIGTLTLESWRYIESDITIGGEPHSGASGTKIRYQFVLNGSVEKITAEVFFKNSEPFSPYYSWKEIVSEESVTVTTSTYSGSKCSYTVKTTGILSIDEDYEYTLTGTSDENSDEIKSRKSPIYDNESMYYVIRSINMASTFSYTFYSANQLENQVETRVAALTSTDGVEVVTPMGALQCYEIGLTVTRLIAIEPYYIYYGKSPYDASGVAVSMPILKIKENDITYTVTSITASETI